MIAKVLAIACLVATCQSRPEMGSQPFRGLRLPPAPEFEKLNVFSGMFPVKGELADATSLIETGSIKHKRQAVDKKTAATGETCHIGGGQGKCVIYYKCKLGEGKKGQELDDIFSKHVVEANCEDFKDICCPETEIYSDKEIEDQNAASRAARNRPKADKVDGSTGGH